MRRTHVQAQSDILSLCLSLSLFLVLPPPLSLPLTLLSYIRQSTDCRRTQGQEDFPPHTGIAEKAERQLTADEERDVIHGGYNAEHLTQNLTSV